MTGTESKPLTVTLRRRALRVLAVVSSALLGAVAVGRLWVWITQDVPFLQQLVWVVASGLLTTFSVLVAVRPLTAPVRMVEGALVGAVSIGGTVFIVGVFGPMLLTDSNLGPLLGFLLLPVGLVVGALLGAVLSRERNAEAA